MDGPVGGPPAIASEAAHRVKASHQPFLRSPSITSPSPASDPGKLRPQPENTSRAERFTWSGSVFPPSGSVGPVRGKRLAIRDFTSSDPYVVARVGSQTAKTKVINSCLNPVWNEELTFSVKEPIGDLKLEVFDRDRFKFDDKMGHTYLSLQPIISASKLKRALQLSTGETKLRKVAPNIDNCLLADSFVTYVNGEIIQDVRLRLCDVESGELYVTLKWFEHPAGTSAVNTK